MGSYGYWKTQIVLLWDPLDLGSCIRAISWDPRILDPLKPICRRTLWSLAPVFFGHAHVWSDGIQDLSAMFAMGSDWIKWIHAAFRLKIFWDHRSEIGIHARRTCLHLKLLKLGKYYLECTGANLPLLWGNFDHWKSQKKNIYIGNNSEFCMKDHETL